jgi:hypothetical protein
VKVKDWQKFQHFKDRRPPWIKLYRNLLDDVEYHNLSPIAAKYLPLIWLLASEDETKEGLLPSASRIAFRLRISEKALLSIVSELSHWLIQDDIKPISERYQLGPSETETETYKKEREGEATAIAVIPQKRGKRSICDEDKPTEKHFAYGQRLGVDVGPEWGKFVNYCKAHDRRYADFEAAFRNWLSNANTFKGGHHAVR